MALRMAIALKLNTVHFNEHQEFNKQLPLKINPANKPVFFSQNTRLRIFVHQLFPDI